MIPSKQFPVSLEPSETARDKAVSTREILPGEVIISNHAWFTALVQHEKGKRCDHCHRTGTRDRVLRKCTGCASYWYCGTTCQNISWKAHHKHLCKLYNQFIASEAWQALDPHQRTDSILLSHCAIPLSTSYVETDEYQSGVRDLDLIAASPVGASFDLMRSSREDLLPYIMLPGRSDYSDMLGGWFGSNNFLLHSHLNPAYSHGIYILASRTLNHSCVPNAAPRFVLEEGKTPRMDVVALTTIKKGHEVTIPYHDPALPFSARRAALRQQYTFSCVCELCTWSQEHKLDKEDGIPEPPPNPTALRSFGQALQEFALPNYMFSDQTDYAELVNRPPLFHVLPDSLLAAFHPSYLPAVSEAFSLTSHEGPLVDAFEMGKTLLALYRIIYPPAFPLIGIHALELAKVCWNTALTHEELDAEMVLKAQKYLVIAQTVLHIYGEEGDEQGPRIELQALIDAMANE